MFNSNIREDFNRLQNRLVTAHFVFYIIQRQENRSFIFSFGQLHCSYKLFPHVQLGTAHTEYRGRRVPMPRWHGAARGACGVAPSSHLHVNSNPPSPFSLSTPQSVHTPRFEYSPHSETEYEYVFRSGVSCNHSCPMIATRKWRLSAMMMLMMHIHVSTPRRIASYLSTCNFEY